MFSRICNDAHESHIRTLDLNGLAIYSCAPSLRKWDGEVHQIRLILYLHGA